MRIAIVVLACMGVLACLAGCPPNVVPDLNATFSGSWWVGVESQTSCDMKLAMTAVEGADQSINVVDATATFDFSCINDKLPELFRANFSVPTQEQTLEGFAQALLYGFDLYPTDDAPCAEEPCPRVVLFGFIDEVDADGNVTLISGFWNLIVRVDGVDVSSPTELGQFSLERV